MARVAWTGLMTDASLNGPALVVLDRGHLLAGDDIYRKKYMNGIQSRLFETQV